MRQTGESMNNAFDKKLRQAAFRFHANLLLERLGILLLLAGVLAAAATLCHRLLAYPTLNYSMLAIAAAFVAALVLAWWLVRRPSRMQLAIILDERLATKERFSTALAMAADDDPFAQAANEEAHARAAGLDPRRQFPVRPSRRWAYAAVAWAAAAAVLAFVPDIDALGLLAQQKHEQQKSQDLAKVAAEIRDQVSKVESTVKQLGDPQLTKDLDALKDMQSPDAQDAKRQAIQKLGDINDRVKELEKKKELDQASALKEMLQQVKTPYNNEDARKISQAVAKGEYAKAAELLKEAQKKIEDGKLSDKEKKDLASQLKEFGEQLDKMAKEDKQLQDELQQLGLDKAWPARASMTSRTNSRSKASATSRFRRSWTRPRSASRPATRRASWPRRSKNAPARCRGRRVKSSRANLATWPGNSASWKAPSRCCGWPRPARKTSRTR